MYRTPFITFFISTPIIGSLFIYICSNIHKKNVRYVSLWTTFITLIISCIFAVYFNYTNDNPQFIDHYRWIPYYNIYYKVALDKFSVIFSILITFVCFILNVFYINKDIPRQKLFFISILWFESLTLGAFCARDITLMIFFMESTIIPIILMISSSCDNNRINKSVIYQYLIYEIISAILIIIAMIYIYTKYNTSDLDIIYRISQEKELLNNYVFFILLIGFGIKIPIWPFFYWLPNVHVKSSTISSVLFASIILKYSSLIIYRILIPIFHNIIKINGESLSIICILGIISSCAYIIKQDNIKKIFAYFSIMHMNLYFIIPLFDPHLMKYFVFSVVNHSILIMTTFLSIDILETIFETKSIKNISNNLLNNEYKPIKFYVFICVLTTIGCPLTSGFISEFVSLYSAQNISLYISIIVGIPSIISSTYIFMVYNRLFQNNKTVINENTIKNKINRVDPFMNISIIILIFIIFFIGICPNVILNYI